MSISECSFSAILAIEEIAATALAFQEAKKAFSHVVLLADVKAIADCPKELGGTIIFSAFAIGFFAFAKEILPERNQSHTLRQRSKRRSPNLQS